METTNIEQLAFSLHGTHEDTVYYVVNGIQRKRSYVIQDTTATTARAGRRAVFSAGVSAWHALNDEQRKDWENRAQQIKHGWEGFNYFLSRWLKTH